MELKVTILGCGSAVPSLYRANSGQVVEIGGKHILIDCGEGTQLQMLKFKVAPFKLDLVLISHLHGDHFFGLPGLLNTLSLFGRKLPLTIIGPPGIKPILKALYRETSLHSSFPLVIREIRTGGTRVVHRDNGLKITAMALDHRVPCYGFHLEHVLQTTSIDRIACENSGLGYDAMKVFRTGRNFFQNEQEFNYRKYTRVVVSKKAYSYITDTVYKPELAGIIRNTDLLYHESTYLNILLDKAVANYHSTALQAAEMARLSGAGTLILGHFSSRYNETTPLLEEARSVFENTELARDGRVFVVK